MAQSLFTNPIVWTSGFWWRGDRTLSCLSNNWPVFCHFYSLFSSHSDGSFDWQVTSALVVAAPHRKATSTFFARPRLYVRVARIQVDGAPKVQGITGVTGWLVTGKSSSTSGRVSWREGWQTEVRCDILSPMTNRRFWQRTVFWVMWLDVTVRRTPIDVEITHPWRWRYCEQAWLGRRNGRSLFSRHNSRGQSCRVLSSVGVKYRCTCMFAQAVNYPIRLEIRNLGFL